MLSRAVSFFLLCTIPIVSCELTAREASPIATSYQSAVSGCLAELRKVLPVSHSLDHFVGTGWDNLRNLHTLPVLHHTFDDCQTTPEGSYLIPDNVVAISVQQTEFDQMAEFHESFNSYFQSVTDTINADGSFDFEFVGASGSYSEKHQKTKMEMATISSNVFITKMKAHSYSLLANPDAGLNPAFKSRLLEIVDHLSLNLTLRAKYEAELLIRDYGTHYVSRAEVGAITEQMNYVNSDFDYKSQTGLDEMKATVSAGFQSFFWGGSAAASTGRIVSDEMKTRLSSMTRHVRINTQGGPSAQRISSCRLDNNKTCSGVIDNLVALDHQGEPLFSLVSTHLLQEIHPVEVYQLADLLKDATMEYYKRNIIPGCTDPKDVNFSFQANINDGTCNGTEPPVPPFGGVYQICDLIETAPADRCDQFVQRNSITGDFRCPEGHHPEIIADFVYAGFEDRVVDQVYKDCDTFLFWTDCTEYTQHIVYKDKIRLRSYSCVPTIPANFTDPGYLFGGIYSKGQPNLWTHKESCPPYYFAAKIAGDVSICLSREMEMGGPYKVPLSTMFSCQSEEAKKKCPPNYSAHLATITQSQCEVYYCIRPGVYKRFDLPQIKRPPYLLPAIQLSNISVHYIRYFVNKSLQLSYPLEVVLNETIRDEVERHSFLNTASSNDINNIVSKWIHNKLKECGAAPRSEGGSFWSSGWFAFGFLAVVVAMLVVALSIMVYHKKRRTGNRQLLFNNDGMREDNA